ncbi:hypothetical protein BX666DRAFT_2025670 [Dichotomocladium elegans]|nr:hypothetical protein BX666DRAFT_2025670 [Dichotomocladium elegans]
MPRTVSLLAGLLAVAAVTYKFRLDVTNNTTDIRRRLEDAKSTLDHVAAGTASKYPVGGQREPPALSLLGESKRYVSTRLVPSVKSEWNAHIASAATSIIHADIPGHAKKIWDEKVAPSFK